jgi:RNA polymerase subunit RPABC4/transcription elongation factor Spt4
MSLSMGLMLLGMMLVFVMFCALLGIIIYKDAHIYGLPPLKWALIAVFVPNLIGLVLYLVARSKVEKELCCSNCKKPVEKDFNLCPHCSCVFENTCQVCKKALKSEFEICPYCGSQIAEGQVAKTGVKIAKKTKLVKQLVAYCVCYFILMTAILIAFIGISVEGYATNANIDNVSTNQWESEFSTISIDTSNKEQINHYFHYTTAVTTRRLKVYADEKPQIDVEVAFESGEIEIQILNEKKEPIFEKKYVGSVDDSKKAKVIKESISLTLSEDQIYDVKFIYKKAKKGTIKIEG